MSTERSYDEGGKSSNAIISDTFWIKAVLA